MSEAGAQSLGPDSHQFRRTAIAAGAATERLLLLDDMWTAYCESVDRHESRGDDPGVDGIVDDMRAELTATRQYAAELYPTFDALDDAVVDAALEDTLRGYPDSESLIGVLREAYPEGIRRGFLAALKDVIESTESEIQLLQNKLDSLKRGGAAAGDLRIRFRCALYLLKVGCLLAGAGALAVAAGVAVPLVAVGTGLIVVGTTADAILGWRDSECRKHAPRAVVA